MSLHPATYLLAWLGFVVALPWLDARIIGFGIVVVAMLVGVPSLRHRIMAMLRRTRFLFLALVLIDVFATPGTPLLEAWLGASAPTVEGVQLAALHAARLVLVLVSLALVLARLGPKKLVAAVYSLLRPLTVIGVPAERIGVRLALVMTYAGQMSHVPFSPSSVGHAMTTRPMSEPEYLEFEVPPVSWRDVMVLALVLTFVVQAVL